MKQKIYILGLLTTMMIFTGTLFKLNHWPVAGILITVGVLMLVFVFLPLALRNNYKAEGNSQNLILYIVTWLTCFVVFLGMLFKIMHWPGVRYFLSIALPFPYVIFLPVFLVVTSKNKNFNIYNTVCVLFLLAIISAFTALLALNVSKERIDDSLIISLNCNRMENAMDGLPSGNQQSPVNQKIDEALKIIDDYQDLILRNEDITEGQWEENPGNLQRPESANIAPAALVNSGESKPGARLEKVLKELVALIVQKNGSEAVAKALPVLLGLGKEKEMDQDLTYKYIQAVNLSWVLIYLDGLETNLKLIKTTI
jgi:hypothetical protein